MIGSKSKLSENFFIKGKRGDGAVTFLGVSVLILVLASFFVYLSPETAEASIFDARETIGIFDQGVTEFYLIQAGEGAIKDSYEEIGGYQEGIGGEIEVLFRKNLVKEFQKYDFQEGVLKQVYEILAEGKFETSSDKDKIILEIEGLEVTENYEGISVKHNPKIYLEFDLRKFGN